MFEGRTIPDIYKEKIGEADFLLTPSTFVKELFDKYFDSDKVFVIPHGVDKIYKYRQRYFPNKKLFRYLWVGAQNPRKGYEEVLVVWKESGLIKNQKMELYIKTTRLGNVMKEKGLKELEKVGNIIIDGRRVSDKELVKIYHNSHCFLFPTRGEGFGLTLAEAMRTGLPCISPYYSGLTDFFDESVGYVINHKQHMGKVTFIGDNREEETEIILPDPNDLFSKMIEIYQNYKQALKIGKKASNRIYRQFTWNKSAAILKSVLDANQNSV
jgi:glycosyltransferase involved in cell wall biosynthesis